MKKVTRADVAKKAGVSETIVSYVMNGNRYVAKDKREKVLAAVEALGYVPSQAARALAGKGTKNILIVASDISSPHFSALIMEFEAFASTHGYNVVLGRYNQDDRFFARNIINWNYSGVVIGSSSVPEEDIQDLLDAGIPVVILEMKQVEGLKGNYGVINTGLYFGAKDGVKALQERGRKQIAFVATLGVPLREKDMRLMGYRDQIQNEAIVIQNCATYEEQSKEVKELWKERHVDAFLCRTDVGACMVLKALAEAGARVPEDVSVIGFDNTFVAALASPTLTTINIQRDKIAENAIRIIKNIEEGKQFGIERVQLETELIPGESF